MKNVISILGFKVNKFNDWLRKNGKGRIHSKVKGVSEPTVAALPKEVSASRKSRQHLRLVK
jgi:hypothetical protein